MSPFVRKLKALKPFSESRGVVEVAPDLSQVHLPENTLNKLSKLCNLPPQEIKESGLEHKILLYLWLWHYWHDRVERTKEESEETRILEEREELLKRLLQIDKTLGARLKYSMPLHLRPESDQYQLGDQLKETERLASVTFVDAPSPTEDVANYIRMLKKSFFQPELRFKSRAALRDFCLLAIDDLFLKYAQIQQCPRYSAESCCDWWRLSPHQKREMVLEWEKFIAIPARKALPSEWSNRARFLSSLFKHAEIAVYTGGITSRILSDLLRAKQKQFGAPELPWPSRTLDDQIEVVSGERAFLEKGLKGMREQMLSLDKDIETLEQEALRAEEEIEQHGGEFSYEEERRLERMRWGRPGARLKRLERRHLQSRLESFELSLTQCITHLEALQSCHKPPPQISPI